MVDLIQRSCYFDHLCCIPSIVIVVKIAILAMFISVTGVIGFDCNFITRHNKNGILKNYNYKNATVLFILK